MDLKDITGINTENTPEYKELLNKHLAKYLTKNEQKGMDILSEEAYDGNPVPFEEINGYLKNPSVGAHFESDEKRNLIRANLLDTNNRRVFYLDMSTATDITSSYQIISTDTYQQLINDVVIEPIKALEIVKDEIKDAI